MIKLQNFKVWLKKQNNLNTLSSSITTALNIGWDERSHTLIAHLKHLKKNEDFTIDIDDLINILNIDKH